MPRVAAGPRSPGLGGPALCPRISPARSRAHPGALGLRSADPRPQRSAWGSGARAPAARSAARTEVGPATATAERGAIPAEQQEQSGDTFVWTQCWYPVMHLDGLDPKVPLHVDLLGKSLVVWADSRGAWHCLEDLCPHRLAPLSEGRVEKDSLQCSYHGWTFNSQGACDNIPQIPPGPARDKACGDRKACVRSYPTSVSQGLLWVWPEAGPEAAKRAAETPVGKDVTRPGDIPWYRREMPNRAVTQLENLLDPSHVAFAHHGLQGDRYRAQGHQVLHNLFISSPVDKGGFKASCPSSFGGVVHITYSAPFGVQYAFERPGAAQPVPFLQVMAVPTKPGWVALYVNAPSTGPSTPEPWRTLKRHVERTSWGAALQHMTMRNPVFEGDGYMLHVLERKMPLAHGVGLRATKDYYVPGKADVGVLAFRQWLSQHGGEVPTCTAADAALEPPLMPKEQVLERYHQHTKDCAHCKRVLTTIDGARAVASVVAVASAMAALAAGVAAAVLPRLAGSSAASASASVWGPVGAWWQVVQQAGLHPVIGVGLLLAVAAALLHSVLGKWRQKAFYEDYVHALRD